MITFIGFDQVSAGGGQQLVINLASGLFYSGDVAKVYCSKESFVYKGLAERNINFNHIDSNIVRSKDISSYIHSSDVVVLMYFSVRLLSALRRSNPKVIFYSIFPEMFFSYSNIFKIPIKANLLNCVYSLHNANALYFMDYSNYKTLHEFSGFTTSNLSYIPIPVNIDSDNSYEFKTKDNIVITYIGRGDEYWKVYPVVKMYRDLLEASISFELQIITTESVLFEKMLSPYLVENVNMRVTYVIGLSGLTLSNYIKLNSDLHFSMGTSALEAAKLGVPTILVDYSHSHFPDSYLYRWIFEDNNNYNLGFLIEPLQAFRGMKMIEITNMFKSAYEINEISQKCFEYCNSNHSLDTSVKALQAATVATLYCVNDLFKNSMYLKVKRFVLYLMPMS